MPTIAPGMVQELAEEPGSKAPAPRRPANGYVFDLPFGFHLLRHNKALDLAVFFHHQHGALGFACGKEFGIFGLVPMSGSNGVAGELPPPLRGPACVGSEVPPVCGLALLTS